MPREIKFRAWDKVYKKMIDSPMAMTSDWVLFTAEVENESCHNAIHPIQQYEIMQYTGLKDNNGKEIFEGDIARGLRNQYGEKIEEVEEVKYDKNMQLMPFHEIVGYHGELWMYEASYEIIGNIYERPDLLPEVQHAQ